MKRRFRGSFTIEASVIVPVILMIFSLILTMLFYFHDKNVVAAISHETLVMGCGKEQISAEELEQYLQRRVQRKLLLFGKVNVDAKVNDEEAAIVCSAKKKGMYMRVELHMRRTDPEQYIWKLKRIEEIKDEIKNEIEDEIEEIGENQ